VCWEVRESIEGRADWDLVVVDAAESGHIISQLDAPKGIQELVSVGMVREQTDWMDELLSDHAITALNVVTTPEEMPISETIELVQRAKEELSVLLGIVVVNRVLPELFTRADEQTFEALRRPEPASILEARAGPGTTAVLEAARLAVSLRRTRVEYLSELRQAIDLPLAYLPYLFVRDQGMRVTKMVADELAQELGI
jgi:anion-transporting  ArsA/GET3 family ATPase